MLEDLQLNIEIYGIADLFVICLDLTYDDININTIEFQYLSLRGMSQSIVSFCECTTQNTTEINRMLELILDNKSLHE
jgi:hypothetical protein